MSETFAITVKLPDLPSTRSDDLIKQVARISNTQPEARADAHEAQVSRVHDGCLQRSRAWRRAWRRRCCPASMRRSSRANRALATPIDIRSRRKQSERK